MYLLLWTNEGRWASFPISQENGSGSLLPILPLFLLLPPPHYSHYYNTSTTTTTPVIGKLLSESWVIAHFSLRIC